MLNIFKETNWLIILSLSKSDLTRSGLKDKRIKSTLIRKVILRGPGSNNNIQTFLVQMDGEGTHEFTCKFSYDEPLEVVNRVIETWATESVYLENDGELGRVVNGDYHNRCVFFTGTAKRTELLSISRFLKNLLENVDFEDPKSKIFHYRRYTKGDSK